MTYLEVFPTGQLAKSIEKFWYCQAADLTNTTLTIPFLYHELVFNFSDRYSIARLDGGDNDLSNTRSWISGIQTNPIVSTSSGKHEMMGVLFKPSGLRVFARSPLSEFGNRFTDATLVFDRSFRSLIEEIQSTPAAMDKISLIAAYLSRIVSSDTSPRYLSRSLNILESPSSTKVSIMDTCDRIMISNRSMIRTYKNHIGVTPMKYLQIQSINRAIDKLSKDPSQSLSSLAYELNYCDQSHFIKSFKATTGLRPRQYVDRIAQNRTSGFYPNFVTL